MVLDVQVIAYYRINARRHGQCQQQHMIDDDNNEGPTPHHALLLATRDAHTLGTWARRASRR